MNKIVEIDNIEIFLIKHLSNVNFYFLQNEGNAGDSFLSTITRLIFDRNNFLYTEQTPPELIESGSTVVLGGGGSCREGGYNHTANTLRKVHLKAKKIIVLPHTISGNASLLHTLGDNIHLILRERKSYDHVAEHAPEANYYLAHDMAFTFPDINTCMRRISGKMSGLKIPQILRIGLLVIKYLGKKTMIALFPRKSTLTAFRIDRERTFFPDDGKNEDVSIIYRKLFSPRIANESNISCRLFLKYIMIHKTVKTNRLHVAIAAALLGKDVLLYPNTYYKNEEVFDYSLKGRFVKVRWCPGVG